MPVAARTVHTSRSYRLSVTAAGSKSPATSSVTAEKSAAGAAPSATSVATRRSADCSSTSRRRLSRASLLADGGGDELGEVRESHLDVDGKPIGQANGHRTPD